MRNVSIGPSIKIGLECIHTIVCCDMYNNIINIKVRLSLYQTASVSAANGATQI